ncbi:protein serine/threonine phosphatase [Paramagnetospirillum caucaseum]|uniref:Protein serine/threonine phosphatase n=1 Tax=Paramagnetospirillum caucaseum TaxID=1244869 RepID=M2Z552_9PROT|nr:protein phosphatase 2C domain-containing protein [Paramagnetospirillum caucaseum]EME69455.1 protein serine/threonine phosphatase [Paramagnetospirillum caucaseum]
MADPAGPAPVRLEMAALTDPGKVRQNNEDCCFADPDLRLALVADGMGGHEAGEVASRMVVDEIVTRLATCRSDDIQAAMVSVQEAVASANGKLVAENVRRGGDGAKRMGTTLAGAWWPSLDRVVVFNVGDSRVYRLRGQGLTQLSQDHSVYEEWRRAGAVGAAPRRNILSRAIGPSDEVAATVTLHDCGQGDVIILCSDGLWGVVEDDRLAELARSASGDVAALCRLATDSALAAGGPDNVTVVAVAAG